MDMVTFRSSIMTIIPVYFHWALEKDIYPSPAEYTRLKRGIYRYQLLCLVAGPSVVADRQASEAAATTLVELFEPWEVEEIFCFFQYAEEMQGRRICSIRRDLPLDMGVDLDFVTEFGISLLRRG